MRKNRSKLSIIKYQKIEKKRIKNAENRSKITTKNIKNFVTIDLKYEKY